MGSPGTTPALVLAAGAGSRYTASGGPGHKLLAPFRGRPVVSWAVEHAVEAGLGPVYVVVGAVEVPVPKGVELIRNPRWSDGIATSLRAAVDAVTATGCEAVVVGLGDQPLVEPEAWRRVAEARARVGAEAGAGAGAGAAAGAEIRTGIGAEVVTGADVGIGVQVGTGAGAGTEAGARTGPGMAGRADTDRGAPIAVATYDGVRGHPVRLAAEVWPLLPPTGDEAARTVMRAHPELVVEVPCPGRSVDVDTVEDLSRWS